MNSISNPFVIGAKLQPVSGYTVNKTLTFLSPSKSSPPGIYVGVNVFSFSKSPSPSTTVH